MIPPIGFAIGQWKYNAQAEWNRMIRNIFWTSEDILSKRRILLSIDNFANILFHLISLREMRPQGCDNYPETSHFKLNLTINKLFPPLIFISGHLFVNLAQFLFHLNSAFGHLMRQTQNLWATYWPHFFLQLFFAMKDLLIWRPCFQLYRLVDILSIEPSCSHTYHCTACGRGAAQCNLFQSLIKAASD